MDIDLNVSSSSEILRDLSDLNMFADLTSVPYLGYDGNTTLSFGGDLTDAEIAAIRLRCTTQPNEEIIRAKFVSAMGALQNYLDLSAPTAAQNVAQIKLQARILRGLLRWELKDFTDNV